jgi:hypothetical protein
VSERTNALRTSAAAFAVLSVIAIALFVAIASFDGTFRRVVAHPFEWMRTLDPTSQGSILFTAAQIVGAVLSVAITVSAIIVELAANRYNHRITWLFVREPFNVVIMSLFVITTLLCVWIATTASTDPPTMSHGAFAVMMVLASISVLALLPYFAFVFAFLSPISVIEKITDAAYRAIHSGSRRGEGVWQRRVAEAVDELHDVARSAIEQSDRGIAMACVDAFADLLERYIATRETLPEAWFEVADVADDPDFVSFAPVALDDIDRERLWFEVKIYRQYLSLLGQCVPRLRDIANLIAIDTRRIASIAALRHPALVVLSIRCFNRYLRTTIAAADQRTTYYLMNQYRALAEELIHARRSDDAVEIARHFRYYGQLAHKMGQSFLLEVAAYDVVALVEVAIDTDAGVTDDLLAILLELDQEIRTETQEESLLGVRRAQIALATLLLTRGDDARVQRIVRDLRGEKRERLDRIRAALEGETRAQFWELEDRGVNFGYLPPERRSKLPALFRLLD